MEQVAIIRELEKLRPVLVAEGISHIAMFGSRARGDQRPDSDLDLLIDVDPNARFSILNLVGIESIVSDATGLPVNAFMRRSLEDQFTATSNDDVIEIF